jgi:hypothetical protein
MSMYEDSARPLGLFVFTLHRADGSELPTKVANRPACTERFLHVSAVGSAARHGGEEPDRDEAWEHASDLLEAQGIEVCGDGGGAGGGLEVCWERRVHAPVDSWVCFRWGGGGAGGGGEVRVSRVQ